MSGFIDPLDLRAHKPGEWVVLSPMTYVACLLKLEIVGDAEQSVTVPQGFITDLASIPRLLRPVFNPMDASRRPAVLHDWLYCSRFFSRARADRLFLDALQDEGVGLIQRWLMYLGVRCGGWLYWSRRDGLELDDFVEPEL